MDNLFLFDILFGVQQESQIIFVHCDIQFTIRIHNNNRNISLHLCFRMSARFPARQLTKAAIRDQLLVHIIPIVNKTCSVIGVKCNWSVQGGLNGIRSAWQEICQKRNECDQALKEIPGVAFYFSSISTFTRKRKEDEPDNVSENESDHEDGDEESLISSQASQVKK